MPNIGFLRLNFGDYERRRGRRTRSTITGRERSPNAVVARSVSVFSFSRFREHWRSGRADHDDVQSHGREASLVIERSLRKNTGLLPHASRSGAVQLAIYVGYLKRKVWGGVLAGLTFIVPGAAVMIFLSWLYVKYGQLPQVMNALYVLKPAVLGVIAAGIIKLGRAAIRNIFLGVLLVGAFVGMRFAGVNFLLILLIAGGLNLIVDQGLPFLKKTAPTVPLAVGGFGLALPLINSRLFQVAWLFLKTGLLSFGGAYASLVFVQRGAVAQYHWLSDGQ